jgi:8-oxo-dGTP pyrophosphatase MutT (NUDIX family)
MAEGRIRPIALCVVRRNDELLVYEAHDAVKGQTFYRLLGGGIEFGETGAEAAARELREEIDADFTEVGFLGALENIFTYEGRPGHELALIYAGRIDPRFHELEEWEGRGDDSPFRVLWKPVSSFVDGAAILYPEGVLDLLD